MAAFHRIIIRFIVGIAFVLAVESYEETRYTPWNTSGWGSAVYLYLHNVNCYDKGLTMFQLQQLGDKIRYKYKCDRVDREPCKLRTVTNRYTVYGSGSTVFLDRQTVNCGLNGVINEFRLRRNAAHTHWRYEYICCDKPSPFVCYDDATDFTNDGNGMIYYLDRQTVKCSTGFFLQSFRLNLNSGLGKLRYVIRCCK